MCQFVPHLSFFMQADTRVRVGWTAGRCCVSVCHSCRRLHMSVHSAPLTLACFFSGIDTPTVTDWLSPWIIIIIFSRAETSYHLHLSVGCEAMQRRFTRGSGKQLRRKRWFITWKFSWSLWGKSLKLVIFVTIWRPSWCKDSFQV